MEALPEREIRGLVVGESGEEQAGLAQGPAGGTLKGPNFRIAVNTAGTADRPEVLDERLGDLSLIEKSVTSQWAAITCPSSRFYGHLD
jgi:hypothetical protein